MAKGKHSIQVQVLADTRKAVSALKGFTREAGLDKLGNAFKTVGKVAAAGLAAAGVAAGAYLKDAVGKAGDLEQSVGAVDTVFKGSAGQMHKWAGNAAQSVGLTANSYNELATILGTQLKNGGTAMKDLGAKTNELIGLGADLSSMFGGTTADAVGALSSALKGERDPIERYGVTLKQATIDAKAAEMGFKKVGGSLSNEAQQAATLALIMEQTKDAHGNFAKEADTIQGKTQRLTAAWENISAEVGTALLPALVSLAEWASTNLLPAFHSLASAAAARLGPALQQLGQWASTTLLPALQQLGQWVAVNIVPSLQAFGTTIVTQLIPAIQQFGAWLVSSQGWLVPLAAGIGGVVAAYKAWTIATAGWKAITTAATLAQTLMNAAMSANPIGIVVLAIAGLVAALVALYKNNETVRKAIDTAWRAIKSAIGSVANWFTRSAWPALRSAFNALSGAAGSVGRALSSAFNAAKRVITGWANSARSAFNVVVSAVRTMGSNISNGINNVVGFFRSLPGKISSALSGIGGRMASIGRNMITSLARALSPGAIISKMKSVIGDAIGFAKRLLGIASPSKVFTEIGRQTGKGLEIGLERSTRLVRSAAGGMASAVIDAGTPGALTVPALAGAGLRGGTMFAPTINVSALHPTPETGRIIADAVEKAWRRRGVR